MIWPWLLFGIVAVAIVRLSGGLQISLDPPSEWGWQRRAAVVAGAIATLILAALVANDFYRPTSNGDEIASILISLVAMGTSLTIVLRLILWIFPGRPAADRGALEKLILALCIGCWALWGAFGALRGSNVAGYQTQPVLRHKMVFGRY